jgi:hypothetical protein
MISNCSKIVGVKFIENRDPAKTEGATRLHEKLSYCILQIWYFPVALEVVNDVAHGSGWIPREYQWQDGGSKWSNFILQVRLEDFEELL